MRRRITALSVPAVAVLAGLLVSAVSPARAEEGREHVSPVTNAAALKECSACHLAFPAKFLSAEAWKKIIDNLPNHFGEDASLPDATRAEIEAYYVKNAGHSQPGLIRISQQSWWLREHRAVGHSSFEKAKSKANCAACHTQAVKGVFEDED